MQSPEQQLVSAIAAGDIDRVESLLRDRDVDVNWGAGTRADNALSTAVATPQTAIVKRLLERGADPNIETDERETPLLWAAYYGNTAAVALLIEVGADVDIAETRYGFAPLTTAARKGHIEVIRRLLDAGADRTLRVKDGRTAFELARDNGHPDAADMLSSDRRSTAVTVAQ